MALRVGLIFFLKSTFRVHIIGIKKPIFDQNKRWSIPKSTLFRNPVQSPCPGFSHTRKRRYTSLSSQIAFYSLHIATSKTHRSTARIRNRFEADDQRVFQQCLFAHPANISSFANCCCRSILPCGFFIELILALDNLL